MEHIDAIMYLAGDEDGGVGINCRVCNRGGAPIAYYQHPSDTDLWSRDDDVQTVHTIAALTAAGQRHADTHPNGA